MQRKERITEEYNKHARQYMRATKAQDWKAIGFAAFMCNAIHSAVRQSKNILLKRYFDEHALLID